MRQDPTPQSPWLRPLAQDEPPVPTDLAARALRAVRTAPAQAPSFLDELITAARRGLMLSGACAASGVVAAVLLTTTTTTTTSTTTTAVDVTAPDAGDATVDNPLVSWWGTQLSSSTSTTSIYLVTP